MMEKYITCSAPCGKIRGRIKSSGIAEFLGIPYGISKRFCSPKPISWEGERDCLEYGNRALQPNFKDARPPEVVFKMEGNSDCLNLNVWSADVTSEQKLPVVVYIHGGAYQKGSNSQPERAGDRFMEQEQMVFVSINYRLGVFGFLQLEDEAYVTSGNNGVLDILLAMRWVKDNISAFGGDSNKITVMGISAGAKVIGSLLTHPDFQKCCNQIILESGAMQTFRTLETAQQITARYKAVLGIKDESELFTLPEEQLVRAQSVLCDALGTVCYFGPVLDDKVFRLDWKERWEQGKGWHGNAILGSNKCECYSTVNSSHFSEPKDQILKNLFGNQAVIAQNMFDYCRPSFETDYETWMNVLSDFMYRYYTDDLANTLEMDGCKVWNYSFEFGIACHAMGFGFIMGQQHEARFHIAPKDKQIVDTISKTMRRMIHQFILTGTPAPDFEWSCYQGGNKMVFDRDIRCEYRPKDTLNGFPDQVFRL